MTEPRLALQTEEESTFTTASTVTEPKHFTESSLLAEGSVEPEMEWDDFPESLQDIPEEDWDIEGAFLPPSVAVATCEAVAEPVEDVDPDGPADDRADFTGGPEADVTEEPSSSATLAPDV